MNAKKIRIAVVSDLHCHPEDVNDANNATLLFTDKLRDEIKQHPIESLKELKKNNAFDTVDILLCPGDFAHQSSKQGILSGWAYVQEMANVFEAKDIYSTLGNHDIDSRHIFSQYSFTFPKGVKQNFPLKDEDMGTFWEKGYTFIERDEIQILIVDSTHYHTHKSTLDDQSVKGKITASSIEEIENYLAKGNNDRIKIMLCHHHPIQHSNDDLGEYDFIQNGEDLVNILAKHNFDMIIHGHKHDPKFRIYETNNDYLIPILSSGSFSATSQLKFCGKFNFFHIIEIIKGKDESSKGTIQTWNFMKKIGWSDKNNGFLPRTGYGVNRPIDEILESIRDFLVIGKPHNWSILMSNFPELNYLSPAQLEEFESKSFQFNLIIKPSILDNPKFIIRHE